MKSLNSLNSLTGREVVIMRNYDSDPLMLELVRKYILMDFNPLDSLAMGVIRDGLRRNNWRYLAKGAPANLVYTYNRYYKDKFVYHVRNYKDAAMSHDMGLIAYHWEQMLMLLNPQVLEYRFDDAYHYAHEPREFSDDGNVNPYLARTKALKAAAGDYLDLHTFRGLFSLLPLLTDDEKDAIRWGRYEWEHDESKWHLYTIQGTTPVDTELYVPFTGNNNNDDEYWD